MRASTLLGGGGDFLTVSIDGFASQVSDGDAALDESATLDGGDGSDRLIAGGVLQLALTGGAGADTFVLTAQQWRTQREGDREFLTADSTLSVITAGPTLITDFQVDLGGLAAANLGPGFDPAGTERNVAPTAADTSLTLQEDAAYALSAADFGFADRNGADTLQSVVLHSLPGQGRLSLGGVVVLAGQVVAIDALLAGAQAATRSSAAAVQTPLSSTPARAAGPRWAR